MPELDDQIYARIKALCQNGEEAAARGQRSEAIEDFSAALEVVPAPKEEWESTTWILGAIGDLQFLDGAFEASRETLQWAMHCPGAIGNPFLHLRLGQCQFELENLERAGDELARAYLGGGDELFEAEDPKYLKYVHTILVPPPQGWAAYWRGEER